MRQKNCCGSNLLSTFALTQLELNICKLTKEKERKVTRDYYVVILSSNGLLSQINFSYQSSSCRDKKLLDAEAAE